MRFAYEINFERGEAVEVMTLTFEVEIRGFETRLVEEMKQKLLWESLCLIRRKSANNPPRTIRSVKRISPSIAELEANGMIPEAPDLTDWAVEEFGELSEGADHVG